MTDLTLESPPHAATHPRRYTTRQHVNSYDAEWFGVLPPHWQYKRLKFSVRLINVKVEPDAATGEYVGMENIESWTGRELPPEKPAEPDGLSCAFREGDALFGKLRPYLAKAWMATRSGICSSELLVMRPRLVSAPFLIYMLLCRDFINAVDSSTYGSKMPRANWEFIGNLRCPIPPYDEQSAIIAFLDRETARIDRLIADKTRLIELLAEKRAAVLSKLVTGGCTSNVRLKDSRIPSLGSIPQHWRVSRAKYVSRMIVDGVHQTPEYVEQGIPFVTVKNLTAGTGISFDDIKYITPEDHRMFTRRAKPEPGDILITKDGTLGVCRVIETDVEFSIFVSVALLKPKHTVIDSWFLRLAFESQCIAEQFAMRKLGSGLKHLHLEEIGGVFLPLPPIEEQRKIVQNLKQQIETFTNLSDSVERQQARLIEYRSALITAAVTGRIDVRKPVDGGVA